MTGTVVSNALEFLKLKEDKRIEWLKAKERDSKWSARNSVDAKGFVDNFLTAQNLFYSYPVDIITTTSRGEFMKGNYTTALMPLNQFLQENQTFQTFLGGAFGEAYLDSDENRNAESRMDLWARRVNGVRVQLAEPDPPQLLDSDGTMQQHPHGSVLDFEQRPPHLQHNDALILYLRYRGILRPEHPRQTTEVSAESETIHKGEITYAQRGLVQLTEDAILEGRRPCLLAQVTYIYTHTAHAQIHCSSSFKAMRYAGAVALSFVFDDQEPPRSFKDDGWREACEEVGMTEEKIIQWYGICNANRVRGKKLFESSHVDWRTVIVKHATDSETKQRLFVFIACVTASQRVRSYNTLLAYNRDEKRILSAPSSSCEYVARLGPGCSHQLAIALTISMPTKMTKGELKRMDIVPSHVRALQRTAMRIDYAFGKILW